MTPESAQGAVTIVALIALGALAATLLIGGLLRSIWAHSDRYLHLEGPRSLRWCERSQDLRRAVIGYALQMPQGLELIRGQVKDPYAEDALGPDLEDHLELSKRVCDGVGPDREVDDDGTQDQFRVAEFSHHGPTRDGLSYPLASAVR